MKSHLILLFIGAVTILGCNRVKLPSGHSDAPYLAVLEQGLTNQVDLMRFPRGQVQIMSALSSQMESDDSNRLRFKVQYLDVLQRAQKDGLLNLTEKLQSSLESVGNMGARFFTVSPTEKLLQLHDAKRSNDKCVAIPIGTVKVIEVLKENEYKAGTGAPGDEFRLVIGRCRDTPTAQAKKLVGFCTQEPQDLKFRAVLQFNPFNKTYTYVIADTGNPEEAGWSTSYVK